MWCDKCFCLLGVVMLPALPELGRARTVELGPPHPKKKRVSAQMRREPPLVVARVPGPGGDGPVRLRLRGLLLWSAFTRGGLRRAAGGPLLRLHVTCIVGCRARGRRGGLPRVAQVPRVHLRADQVRLGRRDACPLLPVPPPCKRCPLPRQRRLRNWARLRGWIVGEASSTELHPSSRRDTRDMRCVEVALVSLTAAS